MHFSVSWFYYLCPLVDRVLNIFVSLFNCTPVVGRQTQWWPRHKAIYFSWMGRSFFVCCLAHRSSLVGFLLLQCFCGVVRHPRDLLQVSVRTRCFCRVLIFVSSQYLSVIYLFPVMIHWWVRTHSRGPNNYMFWAMTEAEGEVGIPLNRFKPPSNGITDRSKAVLLLWFILFINVTSFIGGGL